MRLDGGLEAQTFKLLRAQAGAQVPHLGQGLLDQAVHRRKARADRRQFAGVLR